MSFYEDMENSLLEAIEIEKGNIPLTERKGMPASTYYISDNKTEEENSCKNGQNDL